MSDNNIKVVTLIPSLNPCKKTIDYIEELIKIGFCNIIIINDGSSSDYDHIFKLLEKKQQCTVLKHAVNLGKGRALKTGFNYIFNNFEKSDICGVVTADADGQHSAEDTLKVALALDKSKESLVLGTRNFDDKNVPFKSSFGNNTTTMIFKFLYSKKIKDTQTGLRAIPFDFLTTCISLPGERFEYEINMLITAVKEKINIIEEEIETIYYEDNRETHFDPIKDSIKIYIVMFKHFFKYIISSLTSALIDILLFALLTKVVFNNSNTSKTIFLSTLFARICSSLFNYTVNKNIVFSNKVSSKKTFFKFYTLSVLLMIISWGFVTWLYRLFRVDTTVIKILVDLILFFVSYQIQRLWIFK
ncbi:MAG: glycosyltransferase [Erysipelotrichaceae bacterium]|nr:glycosyltransferase [Erysipelotrichaceae bacterium]